MNDDELAQEEELLEEHLDVEEFSADHPVVLREILEIEKIQAVVEIRADGEVPVVLKEKKKQIPLLMELRSKKLKV